MDQQTRHPKGSLIQPSPEAEAFYCEVLTKMVESGIPFLLSGTYDRFDHVKAVVHGHAHHGSYGGHTPRRTPVFNVAQVVLKPLFGKPYVLEI